MEKGVHPEEVAQRQKARPLVVGCGQHLQIPTLTLRVGTLDCGWSGVRCQRPGGGGRGRLRLGEGMDRLQAGVHRGAGQDTQP